MERENAFILPEDFFEIDEVIFIEGLQGGHMFINILLKLHAKFAKNAGKIAVDDVELPAEQVFSLIARVTRTCLIDARRAVEVFLEKGFMEERDGFLYLTEIAPAKVKDGGAEDGR